MPSARTSGTRPVFPIAARKDSTHLALPGLHPRARRSLSVSSLHADIIHFAILPSCTIENLPSISVATGRCKQHPDNPPKGDGQAAVGSRYCPNCMQIDAMCKEDYYSSLQSAWETGMLMYAAAPCGGYAHINLTGGLQEGNGRGKAKALPPY